MTQKKYLCFDTTVNKEKTTFILKRRLLFIFIKYYYWIGYIPPYILFRYSNQYMKLTLILAIIWFINVIIYQREMRVLYSNNFLLGGGAFNKERWICKKEGSIFSKKKPLKYVCKKKYGYWDDKDLDAVNKQFNMPK
jgi:hypothetical protein